MFSLAVLASAFGVVLAVELPDKTLIATLVLATRYRAGPVLAGVGAAFGVQCLVAVTAGGLLRLLPHRVLAGVVAALFVAGAIVLLRQGDPEDTPVLTEKTPWRMFAASFGLLFAAEWGDASQLATAALTARYNQPVAVFIGSWLALVTVAALAVLLGNRIRERIPIRIVRRTAGIAFAVFAAVAVAGVAR